MGQERNITEKLSWDTGNNSPFPILLFWKAAISAMQYELSHLGHNPLPYIVQTSDWICVNFSYITLQFSWYLSCPLLLLKPRMWGFRWVLGQMSEESIDTNIIAISHAKVFWIPELLWAKFAKQKKILCRSNKVSCLMVI